MAYPVLLLILPWGTSYQYDERVSSARYEDGVEVFERVGINRRTQSIDVAVNITNPVSVDTFLHERRGKPFRLQAINQIQGEDLLFSCNEWEIPEVSRGCWQFKAKFKQVRRFEEKTTRYVNITSDKATVRSGESATIMAGVSGYAIFPEIEWSIGAGAGTITRTVFNQAQYTLPLSYANYYDETVLIYAHLPEENLYFSIELATVSLPIVTSVQISPSDYSFDGGTLTLTATIDASTSAIDGVNWSMRSGIAVLTDIRARSVSVLISKIKQTVIVRATSVSDPTKWAESVISVIEPAIISGIDVSADPAVVVTNARTRLNGFATGSGSFDRGVTWNVTSGSGAIQEVYYSYYASYVYFYVASSVEENAVIEATSIANPLIKKQLIIPVRFPIVVTGVTAAALPTTIKAGETSQLSAIVSGTGAIVQDVLWQVISGYGTIVGGVLSATGVDDQTITAQAISGQDASKFANVDIQVIGNRITSVVATASPLTIPAGGTSNITAVVSGTGLYSSEALWVVRAGSPVDGLFTGSGNSRSFNATAGQTGNALIRVSSVQDPSFYSDVSVTVV